MADIAIFMVLFIYLIFNILDCGLKEKRKAEGYNEHTWSLQLGEMIM